MNQDRTGQVWEISGQIYLVHATYRPEKELNVFLHCVACISSLDNPSTLMGEGTRVPWEDDPHHRRIL